MTRTTKIMGALIALGVAAIVVLNIPSESYEAKQARLRDEKRQEAESYAWRARAMCERFVTESLKAPSTAKFPDKGEYKTVSYPDGSVTVRGYVDAQNSFGAMLRNTWACTVRRSSVDAEGTEHWSLTGPILF